jgi:tRNA G26 N,N-dimethylase Trm1
VSASQTLEELRAALGSHYARWRTLTIAEGEAIADGQWKQVVNLGESKRQLQDLIRTTQRALREECARCGLDAQVAEEPYKALLHELIALEGHNNQTLASQRQQNLARQEELQSVVHTLRQVREVYSTKCEAIWQSYS